ncbi:hypothetical protein Bca101_044955 [Brassica carinata]
MAAKNSKRHRILALLDRFLLPIMIAQTLSYLKKFSAPGPTVHGEVKLDNILFDEIFSAKISDFGAPNRLFLQSKRHWIIALLDRSLLHNAETEALETSQSKRKPWNPEYYQTKSNASVWCSWTRCQEKGRCDITGRMQKKKASGESAVRENRLSEVLIDQRVMNA